jgi:hypothetical protein
MKKKTVYGDFIEFSNYISDLEGRINELASYESIHVDEFISFLGKQKFGSVGKCAICGHIYVYSGNNPAPVIYGDDARCCSKCNAEVVIPTRFASIKRRCKKNQ